MTQTAVSPELTLVVTGASFPEETQPAASVCSTGGTTLGRHSLFPEGQASALASTEDMRSPTSGLQCVPPAVRRASEAD